jgi:ferrous-iron efflux pump FieF
MTGAPSATAAVNLAANGDLLRRATYASMAVAVSLILVKAGAWMSTGSVSVLSSLLDSLLDAAASLVNLFAVRQALVPADAEHRFGHGKAEPLAGLLQSAFIGGSAILLGLEAIQRLASPRPVANESVGIGVMVFAMILSLALVAYQRRVIRATGSVAIDADSLHYRGDILMNAAVIASLVLSIGGNWPFVDPLFAICIVCAILYSAWMIMRSSLDRLMDRELPDTDRERIREIAQRHSEVRAVHDLRTRSSGPDVFIQLHIEMDGGMTLLRSHAIADEVERELKAAFPNAEIIIHQDPAGLVEGPAGQ